MCLIIQNSIEFVEFEIMYNFYIDIENYWQPLVINLSWIIISLHRPYMHYIGLPTSSYLSAVLQYLTFPQGTDKTTMNTKIKPILTKYEAWWLFIWASHHFNFPQVIMLTSNSLLSMRNFSLAMVIWLSLTYPHVSDKARTNNHKASYLVNIYLIFVILENSQQK